MQFTSTLFALTALASSVVAQTPGFDTIISIVQDQNVTAGSSLAIVWQPGSVLGTVSISLLQGADPKSLQLGPVIKANATNTDGKFTWSVPTNSLYATYGIQIALDSDPTTFQYSQPFHIVGGSSSSSSASGTATSTVTGSSTSSASPTSLNSTASASASSTITSSAIITSTPYSNVTTAVVTNTASAANTSLTLISTVGATKSSGSGSSPTTASSSSPTATKNAAAGNMATGGLAVIGGLLMAFAL
ncbi:hypothetical protein G7Y89_g7345 [Cudoniella acicularis]|uniref:Yeast cell wall synthesis Kre9/Knh1-like N-terminal domain-containing protein n=1 Tax=Cudoniella acicularis TaxID=354080 RepID=A0A8H4W1M9_9HELO|nr:hypothetical protein G7Y89_g7345 [Cudoniella acicularis]